MRILAASIWSTMVFASAHADAPAPGSREPTPAWAPRPQSPAVNLTPVIADELPERCRPLAKQVSAPALPQALAARISLAGCLSDQAAVKLELVDSAESVIALEEAMKPAVALLDEVIAAGDRTQDLLASHAKGELFSSMCVRMRSTLPAPDGTAASQSLRDARKTILEAQLAPWNDKARIAYAHVVELAKAQPKLLANPVVKTAVRTSEQRLAPLVAARDRAGSADTTAD